MKLQPLKEQFTPFGYRYVQNQCIIKLRLKPEKFEQAGIGPLGTYRTTSNGYIIFEAVLDTNGEKMTEFNHRMNRKELKSVQI